MSMHQEYKISGVSVLFPCKPYPSQFSMMDKIIKGIQRRQNCLIESPTGSGKSLALLCSALAWQSAEKAKQELAETEEAETNVCTCAHVKVSGSSPVKATPVADSMKGKQLAELSNVSEDDDFKSAGKTANLQKTTRDHKKHIVVVYDSDEDVAGARKAATLTSKTDQNQSAQPACTCSCGVGTQQKPKEKISKIYFGTRTHKQVAQIVRELKKTGYHDVRMTVLGSREHTCIHPQVSRTNNKNEACKELLNDQGCHFKDSSSRLSSQNVVKGLGLSTAWDLEDLVTFCKTKRACPYFLSRGLKDDSDLIICPYNYLVDPMVRDAMKISLKGHVVILDEAHNIEDSAREAASQSLTQDSILKAISDIESLMGANINLADHSKLRSMLKNLDKFIDTNKSNLEQKEYDRSYKIWTGFHIVAQLELLSLGPRQFPEYKAALVSVKSDAENEKEAATQSGRNKDLVVMKPSTQAVLEQMFQVLDYLYRLDLKYVDDYRASLCKMYSYVPMTNDNQWLNSRSSHGGRRQVQVDVYTLNFWCMNPGVAFSDFCETRSIILTSGTLSPMSSFQSELGLEFKIQLETNHVIKDSQVWVGTLGQGPSGSTLQAVFRNLETFAFQDELGNLVLKVCQIVPHGVLCFLPSYNVLDKLMNRWESTGLKQKLDQCKMVIREPKNSDKLNFEDQLSQFYEALTPQSDHVRETDTDGAIFFAVCRGKVSEGLDFADNFARAVITVGVPYPNFKDVQVELKRKYNDQYRQSRGLLSGSEWYEIQAFRALNQALGRCIRHKHDWGALIIVDDRFVKSAEKYCKGLSKWVRNKVHTYQDCSVAMESLSKFNARQLLALKDSVVSLDASLLKSPEMKMLPSQSAMSPDLRSSSMDVKTPLQQMDMRTPVKSFPIFNMGSSVRTTASPLSNMARQQTASPLSNMARQQTASPLSNMARQWTASPLSNMARQQTVSPLSNMARHRTVSPLNNMARQRTASPLSNQSRQQTASSNTNRRTQQLCCVSLDDGDCDTEPQPKPRTDSHTDSLAQDTDSLAQNTDSLAQDTDSLAQDTDSLAQNTDSLAQDTDSLAQNTDSLTQDTDSLAQNTDSLARDTDSLAENTDVTNGHVMLKGTTHSLSSTSITTQSSASSVFARSLGTDSPGKLDAQTDSPGKLPLLASASNCQSDDVKPDSKRSLVRETRQIQPNKKFLFRRSRAGYSNVTTNVSKETSLEPSISILVSDDEAIPSTPVSKDKSIAPINISMPVCKDTSTSVSKDKSLSPTSVYTPVSKDKSLSPTSVYTPVSKDKSLSPTSVYPPVSKDKSLSPTSVYPPVSKDKSIAPTSVYTPVSKDKSIAPTNISMSVCKDTSTHISKDKSLSPTSVYTPVSKDKSIAPTSVYTPVSKDKSIAPTNISIPVCKDTSTPVSKDKSIAPMSVYTPVSKDKTIAPTNISMSVCKDTSTPVSKDKANPPTNISTTVSKDKSLSSTHVSKDKNTSVTCCTSDVSPLVSQTPSCRHAASVMAACKSRGQPGSQDKLQVRRKNRGTKRKYVSRAGLETRDMEEQNTSQKQSKIVISCSVCGCLLVRGVQTSDFQEQRSIPSFLRESDSNSKSTSGSIFFPGNTSCGPLHDIKGCMEGVYTKYDEQEEICVQFLYCGQCLKTTPHNTPPVGAEVKLAAGSGARFSRGQMWLFLGAICQRQEQ